MGILYSRVILPLTTASATTKSSQSRPDPRAKHFWTKDEVPPLDGKVVLQPLFPGLPQAEACWHA